MAAEYYNNIIYNNIDVCFVLWYLSFYRCVSAYVVLGLVPSVSS